MQIYGAFLKNIINSTRRLYGLAIDTIALNLHSFSSYPAYRNIKFAPFENPNPYKD